MQRFCAEADERSMLHSTGEDHKEPRPGALYCLLVARARELCWKDEEISEVRELARLPAAMLCEVREFAR